MDPFTQAQLMMMLAQNPELGSMLDAAGIPAPQAGFAGGGSADAGLMTGAGNPDLASMMDPSAQGALMQPSAAMMQGPPTIAGGMQPQLAMPVPGEAEGGDPATILGGLFSGLGGVKMPGQPKPIFSGGVGAGKAPEVNAAGLKGGSPAIAALMAALMPKAGANTLRVPDLGSLIRGGRY